MKIIGLDVGERRIGLAVADAGVRIAIPDCTLEVDGNELEQIFQIAKSYRTKLFVVGMPRNVAGQETAQSQFVRQFAMALQDYIPEARVKFQDETLTSVEAEKRLKARKRRYQKAEIDAEAASIILQDFIESFTGEIASRGVRNAKNTRNERKTVNDDTENRAGVGMDANHGEMRADKHLSTEMAPGRAGEPSRGGSSAEMPVDATYRQMAPPGSAAAIVGGGMMMAGASTAGNIQAAESGVSGGTRIAGAGMHKNTQSMRAGVDENAIVRASNGAVATGVDAAGIGVNLPEEVAKKPKKFTKTPDQGQTGLKNQTNQGKQDGQNKQNGTAKKKSKLWVILGVVLFLAVACGVGGFMAYGWYNDSLTPVAQVPNCSISNDEACKEVEFTIDDGESSKQIADNLKSADLIRDSLAFQLYLRKIQTSSPGRR